MSLGRSLKLFFINGRSSDGRREWKHQKTGLTFGQWETKQVETEGPQE